MPTEPSDRAASEVRFAHLGGMDLVSDHDLTRRRRQFLAVILGFGALFITLMVWWGFQPLYPHVHETEAINRLGTVAAAEEMYRSNYPEYGYTCSLSALGGDPAEGPPSPTAAQLTSIDFDSGRPSVYVFQVGNCQRETVDGENRVVAYTIFAVPQQISKRTRRGFCMDQSGVIKVDPAGGTNCTKNLGE